VYQVSYFSKCRTCPSDNHVDIAALLGQDNRPAVTRATSLLPPSCHLTAAKSASIYSPRTLLLSFSPRVQRLHCQNTIICTKLRCTHRTSLPLISDHFSPTLQRLAISKQPHRHQKASPPTTSRHPRCLPPASATATTHHSAFGCQTAPITATSNSPS
jgi:hypothetical protein